MDHRWAELARTLHNLGMWRHLPEDGAEAAEQSTAEGRFSILTDQDAGLRWFHVDGEEMAEGAVERVLRDMAPGLQAGGIDLQIETVSRPAGVQDGDYVVAVNGRRCVVWRPEDWSADRAWEVSTLRPLAVVNELLAESGVPHRLFVLGAGGNEGIAWLVDPRIVAAIVDSGLVNEAGLPVLATLE